MSDSLSPVPAGGAPSSVPSGLRALVALTSGDFFEAIHVVRGRRSLAGIQIAIAACEIGAAYGVAAVAFAVPGPHQAMGASAQRAVLFGSAAWSAIVLVAWWVTVGWLLKIIELWTSGREVQFTTWFRVAVVASVYTTMGDVVKAAIFAIKGPTAFGSLDDMKTVAVGLNLLPIDVRGFWWGFLGFINPFEMASLAFLVFAFSSISGQGRVKSGVLLTAAWCAWTAVRATAWAR